MHRGVHGPDLAATAYRSLIEEGRVSLEYLKKIASILKILLTFNILISLKD